MKRNGWAIGAVMVASLAIAGCSAEEIEGGDQSDKIVGATQAEVVILPDGREVICVAWKHGYAGGVTCDWDNAE